MNKIKHAQPATLAGLTFILALSLTTPASGLSTSPAVSPASTAASAAMNYLRASQISDGTILLFGGAGSTSAIGDIADDLFAIRAVGIAPATVVTTSGKTILSPLSTITATRYISGNIGGIGKLSLAVAAADLDPRAFDGLDLVVSMTLAYSSATGSFDDTNTWYQALAMMGMAAAGEQIPITATRNLAGRITGSGGFGYDAASGADTNTTGLVLEALVCGGYPITSTEVLSALAYLKSVQHGDAGFDNGFSSDSDINSTAIVIQGILASKTDPTGSAWQIASSNPISYLLSAVQPDSGIYIVTSAYKASQTAAAIPALMSRTLPFSSRAVYVRRVAANQALYFPYNQHRITLPLIKK